MSSRYNQVSRDSLELASLASSPSHSQRQSHESSSSGVPSSRKLSLEQEDPLNTHNNARSRHSRAFSVGSAFDFSSNLFPLSQTASNGYARIGEAIAPSHADGATGLGGGSLEKHKTLTYLNGLSLIIGLIIGSGIFSSPGQVIARAGSPGASLLIWVIAGVLAWTGAASYAELGGAIPLNGGPQVYLSKIFNELFGFLFTWCAVLVLKPGSAAIIAIIFGEYFVRAIAGGDADVNPWVNKSVALTGWFAVTFINCISTKLGTKLGDMFMFLKFVALLGVTVIGIVVAVTGFSYEGEATKDWREKNWFEGTSTDVSSWAVALYSGLWAFDGWDNVSHALPPCGEDNVLIAVVDQLCGRRVHLTQSRFTPRNPYGHATRHYQLRPRQHCLFLRPPSRGHHLHEHRRSPLRIQSIWTYRLVTPISHSLGILPRCSKRHRLHLRPAGLRRRERRLPSHITRQDWRGRRTGEPLHPPDEIVDE